MTCRVTQLAAFSAKPANGQHAVSLENHARPKYHGECKEGTTARSFKPELMMGNKSIASKHYHLGNDASIKGIRRQKA